MKSQFANFLRCLVIINLLLTSLGTLSNNLTPAVQASNVNQPAEATTYKAPVVPGTLFGWGSNQAGQLGSSTSVSPTAPSLLNLPNVTTFATIAAGNDFNLALTTDNKLVGWGSNQAGQLGNSTNISATTPNPTPASIILPGLPPTGTVTALAAGNGFSLAATSDGKLFAWGSNQFGQLGNSTNVSTTTANPTPSVISLPGVSPTATITALSAGTDFSLVATSDGKLLAWGSNQFGQLGNSTNVSTTTANPTPSAISLPGLSPTSTITALAAGNGFSLAATSDGKLLAWGNNQFGQLGNSTNVSTTTANATPTTISLPGVSPTATITSLAVGNDFSLAATSDGKLFAWGSNQFGQLGNSTNISTTTANPVPSPVTLPGLITGTTVTALAAGNGFSLAATSDGKLFAWGKQPGATAGNSTPQQIKIDQLPAGTSFKKIMAGADHALFLSGDTVNTSWPQAQEISLSATPTGTTGYSLQYLAQPGSSKWFRFPAGLNAKVSLVLRSVDPQSGQALDNLPAQLDLSLYKDIQLAYNTFDPSKNTDTQGAKSAPSAYLPSAYLPSAYLPSAYLPSAYLPSAYLPSAYLPSAYLPSAYLPSAYLPSAYLPSAYLSNFIAPDPFLAPPPAGYQAERYYGIVLRSLLAVSAQDGPAPQTISRNSWDYSGDLYVQVRARPGQASANRPFLLEINVENSSCSGVSAVNAALPAFQPAAGEVGRYDTLLLTDSSRLEGSASEKAGVLDRLKTLATRPEVNGLVIDLGAKTAEGSGPAFPRINQSSSDPKQQGANQIADAHPACPFAKNLVAQEIKKVIDSYQPRKYLVLAGPDDVIPFFRYPDTGGLANEKEYSPPVSDSSPAQAALRNGLVLSQDGYGAFSYYNRGSYELPLPGLAVGRLVDNASQISHMVDSYLAANGVIKPSSALVTGYDFVSDTAQQVQQELSSALSPVNCATANNCVQPGSLITPAGVSPQDKSNWTADQLRNKLLAGRNDIIFAAGHFSAGSWQAPDYSQFSAAELANSKVDYTNALFIGLGCHSGYNIPDSDKLSGGGSPDPDWPKALAIKGMTGLVGTGYQYGDTDSIQYSERLYNQFVKQLHTTANALSSDDGRVTVPVGVALTAAKRNYLAQTASLTGLDEKSLLIATLYGLPMLGVNATGRTQPGDLDKAPQPQNVSSGPGQVLGLTTADLSLSGLVITPTTITLTNRQDNTNQPATYYQGRDGTVGRPLEPLLPLQLYNVGISNTVLRGVGLRTATYTDQAGLFPLTTAPATELAPTRTTFNSPVFYPTQPWEINYLGGLSSGTQLALSLAQYRSNQDQAGNLAPVGTLRRYSGLGLRLYYNGNNTANLAAAPSIGAIQANLSQDRKQINFQVSVAGAGSAGVQEVWATYTSNATGSSWRGQWQSVDLQPGAGNLWQGSLNLPADTDPATVQFMIQAANGLGLVSLASNGGQYYNLNGDTGTANAGTGLSGIPGTNSVVNQPAKGQSSLTLSLPATTSFADRPAISASLTYRPNPSDNPQPVANQPVTFRLGGQQINALTDSQGVARLNSAHNPALSLDQPPGTYYLTANFGGAANYPATQASQTLQVGKRATKLSLDKANPSSVAAKLLDTQNNQWLAQKTVIFSGSAGQTTYYAVAQTDYQGQAALVSPNWPAGTYQICAYFGQDVGQLYKGLSDDLYAASTTACPGQITVTLSANPGGVSTGGQGGGVAGPVPAAPTTGAGGATQATLGDSWTLWIALLAGILVLSLGALFYSRRKRL